MIPFLGKIQNNMSRASERRNERLRRLRLKAKRRSFLEKLEDRHLMAALIVTNGNDSGDGSLRAAIEIANKNKEPDTIKFADNVSIVKITGPVIGFEGDGPDFGNNKTTILGPATIKLSDNKFYVGDLASAEFFGLEVTGAENGAFTVQNGSLLIQNSTIHGNNGGEIISTQQFARVTIVNSTISENNGTALRVYSSGSALVVNSILTKNTASSFGAILGDRNQAAGSIITLHNSIVAGNFPSDVHLINYEISNDSSNNLVGKVLAREDDMLERTALRTGINNNIVGVDVSTVIDTNLKRQNGGNTFVDLRNILTHALVDGSPAIDAGNSGINAVESNQKTPDVLAEVSESCTQLLNTLPDETMKKIVLLKFQGDTNGEVADKLKCTRRTIERKLERIRRIWVEAGLHDGEQ